MMAADQAQFRRASTLDELDALSRTRRLTSLETLRLDRALRRRSEPKGQKPWTRRDLDRLRRYLLRGKKPREIAPLMNRTERAIWRRMTVLGWTVRLAEKGSIAMPGASVRG